MNGRIWSHHIPRHAVHSINWRLRRHLVRVTYIDRTGASFNLPTDAFISNGYDGGQYVR